MALRDTVARVAAVLARHLSRRSAISPGASGRTGLAGLPA